jgi:hypothetical protein
MTKDNTNPDPGADPDLVTPDEHAEATETIDADEHVSDPDVPDDVEVAARSADMSSPSMTHEKVFVLGPGVVNNARNPWTEANGYDHEPNKAATRQYAISAGLWPTGDASFKSAKKHPDGVSWILTYTVPVIPANDAPNGSQSPRVVAADGDTEGALNYSPPSDVDEHGTEPTA